LYPNQRANAKNGQYCLRNVCKSIEVSLSNGVNEVAKDKRIMNYGNKQTIASLAFQAKPVSP
jgi:hypothetical protein